MRKESGGKGKKQYVFSIFAYIDLCPLTVVRGYSGKLALRHHCHQLPLFVTAYQQHSRSNCREKTSINSYRLYGFVRSLSGVSYWTLKILLLLNGSSKFDKQEIDFILARMGEKFAWFGQ